MNTIIDEQMTRRDYQRLLEKRRKRRLKRRRQRLRKVRRLRAVRNVKFWVRIAIFLFVLLLVVFWAKFAFVFDIPSYAQKGPLAHVSMYITVKPWWFGPPVFDVSNFVDSNNYGVAQLFDPDSFLIMRMGRYAAILVNPIFVWVVQD